MRSILDDGLLVGKVVQRCVATGPVARQIPQAGHSRCRASRGLSTIKSRGSTIGTLLSVNPGDVLLRLTAVGMPAVQSGQDPAVLARRARRQLRDRLVRGDREGLDLQPYAAMAPGRQGNWIPSIQKTSAPCTAEHRVSSYPVDFTGTCICPHLARHVYIERCMTPSDITAQILAILESSMEDTRIPDTIAEYADKHVGKPVTKTDAAQLETQLGVPVRIRRQYGMTHVAWTTDGGSSRDERSILLAHSEKNVSWPSAPELRQGEPAYFTARDARNEARRTLLAEHHQMDRIPCVNPSRIERAAVAISKLLATQKELQQLTDYGQPMNVITGAIKKLTGKD